MDKKVSIRYDPDGDMLEVWWDADRGYYTATAHDQVEVNVDLAGGVQGFLVFGVSKLDTAATVDLIPSKSAQAATND